MTHAGSHRDPEPEPVGERGAGGASGGAEPEGTEIRRLELRDGSVAPLVGSYDRNLQLIEERLGVRVIARGSEWTIKGPADAVERASRLLTELDDLVGSGRKLRGDDVETALRLLEEDPTASVVQHFKGGVIKAGHKVITLKGASQRRYVDAIARDDLVFGVGPAGTGKTYLAVAMAVHYLNDRRVKRILLTRPAVEAGEKLGFLPGDLADKVDPYLRPLMDALNDMLDAEHAARLIERGVIEVAPLAFMRGRTLNDSFVILDEAQNTTSEQMKMFLTRLGFNSKAVITGDITQIDLPTAKISGLVEACDVVAGVPGVSFVYFSERDVVRHPLVQRIIRAYRERSDTGPGAEDDPGGSSRTESS